MPIFNKLTASNILILISFIFTIIWYFSPGFMFEWSVNSFYFYKWDYLHWFIQFFTGTFLHWWFLHFLMNAIFIYYFWNILEIIIWKNKYILFFILSVIFNWILLSYFSDNFDYTVWISWFAMSIIAYYTLNLKSLNNPEYKWWITAIIINIWIWFHPWISLYWHLFWVIFWIIFFYLSNDFTKKQLIWFFKNIFKNNKTTLNSEYMKKD